MNSVLDLVPISVTLRDQRQLLQDDWEQGLAVGHGDQGFESPCVVQVYSLVSGS